MINEVVHNGRDNAIWVGVRVARELIDLTEVTKMELLMNDQVYSSEVFGSGEAQVFDWTQTQGTGVLILRLGNLSIPVGFYNAKLVIYSVDNPNGVIWDTMRIRFK
ncbi:MAG: hypothetical protein DRH70_09470 [Candidatus Coatesbacteria bacterium]|nr:MAG: hypothetical protein DRH70_09470 [Candidatus Coatesbacteria bacterium]